MSIRAHVITDKIKEYAPHYFPMSFNAYQQFVMLFETAERLGMTKNMLWDIKTDVNLDTENDNIIIMPIDDIEYFADSIKEWNAKEIATHLFIDRDGNITIISDRNSIIGHLSQSENIVPMMIELLQKGVDGYWYKEHGELIIEFF
jgi:hypothetical protein